MGKLRACLLIALVACGSNSKKNNVDAKMPDAKAIDAKVFMDAPPDAPPMFDLSCLGNSAPANGSANATITVSGTVTEISGTTFPPSLNKLQGATVDACKGNCTNTNKLATATSDANGAFSDGSIATGMNPLTAYLKMTPPSGNTGLVVLEFPGAPLTKDLVGVPILTFDSTAQALLPNIGCTQDTAKGMVALAVTDCMNNPITDTSNITVTVTQAGVMQGGTPINLGNVSAMAKGTYLICNVPASTTTHVAATYNSMTFLAHDVTTVANELTATQVRPGY